MRARAAIVTVLAALLAGTAGWWVSSGSVGERGLIGTGTGRGSDAHPAATTAPTDVTPAQAGQPVGPLALVDLHGQPATLPGGRRVLVNLWASWCQPCRDEMPLLSRYAATQGHAGVVVVGLAEDDAASVGDFLRKYPVGYPIVLDDAHWHAGTRLGNGLGVLPYTALIGADGRLLRQRVGTFDDAADIQRWVDAGD